MKKLDLLNTVLRYRGILLDLDNTLYTYKPCHMYALQKCSEYFNAHIASIGFDEFQDAYGSARAAVKKYTKGTVGSRSRHLYFQRLLETRFKNTRIEDSLRLGDLYWSSFIEVMELRPWVQIFLENAKQAGIMIAIVTNLESSLQYKKLMRLNVTAYIDYVVTSEEAAAEKPNAAIFSLALDKLGMNPYDVVMVGDDRLEDGEGAAKAGIEIFYVAD